MPGSAGWSLVCPSGLTADTPSPTVLAVFDNQRYLFNVGDGASRALVQCGAGHRRLANVFVTRADTSAAGGLAGASL